mgnify:CR=1 FL=1
MIKKIMKILSRNFISLENGIIDFKPKEYFFDIAQPEILYFANKVDLLNTTGQKDFETICYPTN